MTNSHLRGEHHISFFLDWRDARLDGNETVERISQRMRYRPSLFCKMLLAAKIKRQQSQVAEILAQAALNASTLFDAVMRCCNSDRTICRGAARALAEGATRSWASLDRWSRTCFVEDNNFNVRLKAGR